MENLIVPSEIQARHQKQLAVMRGFLEGRQWFRAAKALELARTHATGFRKDQKTPSFHHQLSVGRLATTLVPSFLFPEETIAAAFLHDTVEDYGDKVSVDSLRPVFGNQIADAVWRLSKKSVGVVKTHEAYFGEIAKCPVASIVKLCDRAHNFQTMVGVFSVEKQKAYIKEVEDFFFPMIKVARRAFPEQFPAYENLKITLRNQKALIEAIHRA